MIAYFKLVMNTQQPQYLQSLQCHINTGFRGLDKLLIAYPRRQTHDVRALFARGATVQFLGN